MLGSRLAIALALPLVIIACTDDGDGRNDGLTTMAGDGDDDKGDGDGESGDGDDDTGDGDSETMLRALEVIAGGERIGYLQSVGEYTLAIWDDESDVLFNLNDLTGFVAGGVSHYYSSSNCGGYIYITAPFPADGCLESPPARRRVWGNDNDALGFEEASEVWVTSGGPTLTEYHSIMTPDGECTPLPDNNVSTCLFPTATTSAVPTSFELPIEIVDAE